jgi:hypothetical protein
MDLSPSSEVASCAVRQEFRNNLWKPKIHYRVHKIPRNISTRNENTKNLRHVSGTELGVHRIKNWNDMYTRKTT